MFRAIELGDKYLKHLITSDTKEVFAIDEKQKCQTQQKMS